MPRLLVLTLSNGEAALPTLTQQLAQQSFSDFDHEIIAGLSNRAAHNRLYQIIMNRAASFDFFLKLDADMTLRSTHALAAALRAADSRPDVQHFAFPIWDCFTEEETLGVHLFRSGVRWPEIADDLFVDPDPPNVTQLLWRGSPAPFANHGEVVSDFECFSFGVHKFLKVAQRQRAGSARTFKHHKHARHMQNCARIRDLYRTTHARRHQLAVAGMMWAMRRDDVAAMSSKADLQQVFEREVRSRDGAWNRRVERLSRSVIVWRLALLKSLGPARAFA